MISLQIKCLNIISGLTFNLGMYLYEQNEGLLADIMHLISSMHMLKLDKSCFREKKKRRKMSKTLYGCATLNEKPYCDEGWVGRQGITSS